MLSKKIYDKFIYNRFFAHIFFKLVFSTLYMHGGTLMWDLFKDDSIFDTDMEISADARTILESRYLLRDKEGTLIETPKEMCLRVATEAARSGAAYNDTSHSFEERRRVFYWMLANSIFSPNSPTWMNAGTSYSQNAACFVLPVHDSLPEIFDAVKGAALIHQSGGGTGFDFSKLRPTGDVVKSTGGVASGPVSFMAVFNAATEIIKQGGKRRGANMGILRVDHPDIEEFISCKEDNFTLSNFNISVGITDAFMEAVEADADYEIINPRVNKVVGTKNARYIFQLLTEHSWKNGEPGIVFLDRIEEANPTPALGTISATNPCGEQPLLPYEACHLGSINLQKMYIAEGKPINNFGEGWCDSLLMDRCKNEISQFIEHIDWDLLSFAVSCGTDFLDSIIDVSSYPLQEIDDMVRSTRKIGLGFMGLADLFIMLGVCYDSSEAELLSEIISRFITYEAREMSKILAAERGPFPAIDKSIFTEPVRNATVTTIAPTGTISMIANASSGCEPLFGVAFTKKNVLGGDKDLTQTNPLFIEDAKKHGIYSDSLFKKIAENFGSLSGIPEIPKELANLYRTSLEIDWEWHVRIQAAVQRGIDNAVSKTINMSKNSTVEDIQNSYLLAYRLGCKGLTVYRSGSRETEVISSKESQTSIDNLSSSSFSGMNTVDKNLWGKVKPIERPEMLYGITSRVATPLGTLWATLNLINNEQPFELFCQISKAGTDISAFTEAIARLISLCLRSGVDPSEIVHQLRGIGGSGQVGFGPNKVLSVPDAIGRLLAQVTGKRHAGDAFITPKARGTANHSPNDNDSVDIIQDDNYPDTQPLLPFDVEEMTTNVDETAATRYDLCPSCGNYSLIYASGCCECTLCGYSAC